MNEFEADELEARDVGIAFYVAIQNTNNWPADTCVAWVESKGGTCGRERSQGYLCARHHTTATKRREKDVKAIGTAFDYIPAPPEPAPDPLGVVPDGALF